MIYIGIDPSQRHTGLCVLRDNDYVLSQIDTTSKMDLQTSVYHIRGELLKLMIDYSLQPEQSHFGIERMIPGAATSPLMFAVQTIVYDTILTHFDFDNRLTFVTPYPVQLKHYMRKQHGVDIKNKKTGIIDGYKLVTGDENRVSSHRAEAYFLSRMAIDVDAGCWSFTQKKQRLRIFPWE